MSSRTGSSAAAPPRTLDRSRELVLPGLQAAVQRLDPGIRGVVAYHFGWRDQDGHPVASPGGKAVRPGLALLAAEAAGGRCESAVPGAIAVELVHNFSLVHDDLMDRDAARRHRPTVWAQWGDATAVLAGDAMLSLANEVLFESDSPYVGAAGRVVAVATRELIRGQAADVAFERRTDVSLAECFDMAAGKTGALLSASAAVGAVFAGARRAVVDALASYGAQVGLAFQLVDDLLGIWGRPEVTGKPVHSDLRSRKKSLPITWAIENGGGPGRRLARWLADDSVPPDVGLSEAAELVERSGARTWATTQAQVRVRAAEAALASVDLLDRHRADLRELAHFIVEREA